LNNKPGNWIRPISRRSTGELCDHEIKFGTGETPTVLDIIDVPLQEPHPTQHQRENWLVDTAARWAKVGKCSVSSLAKVAETGGKLWVSGFETARGKNNRVPVELAACIMQSLRLIRVESITILVSEPKEPFGDERARVRAEFKFSGEWYRLSITDHEMEMSYIAKGEGRYSHGPHYLTVSLGEEFKGHYYKLVAAAIEVMP
jgi:hypothetical protein